MKKHIFTTVLTASLVAAAMSISSFAATPATPTVTVVGDEWVSEDADWIGIYADQIGASEITVYGGGNTVVGDWDKSLNRKAEEDVGNANSDIIILLGGKDDIRSWDRFPVGDPHPLALSQSYPEGSYAPALRKTLKTLKGNNPEAKIVYILERDGSESVSEDRASQAFRDAAHDVCEDLGIEFASAFDPETEDGKLSPAGAAYIAEVVVDLT